MPWAWGAIAYFPIPFFNVLISGLVQWRMGLAEIKHGGLAAANGRRAANWGLTQLTWFVFFVVAVVGFWALALSGVLGPVGPDGSVRPPAWVSALMMGVVSTYLLISLLQFIYLIVGILHSSKGREVKLPVIPFVKG